MRYYLDTEFIENGQTIDLISIGIVADDGREYYAVNQQARLDNASDWVRDNVLPHLPKYGDDAWKSRYRIMTDVCLFFGIVPPGYGRLTMLDFIAAHPIFKSIPRPAQPPDTDKIEIWGYFAGYDWVAFCQLFGRMIDLPDGFPRYCRDLKQMAVMLRAEHLKPSKPQDEHHALADARWNRTYHKAILDHASLWSIDFG